MTRQVAGYIGPAATLLRDKLGLSQRAAALRIGISHVHLNNIENGKVSPSFDILEKYYEAFGVDVYLLAMFVFCQDRIPRPLLKSTPEIASSWLDLIDRLRDKPSESES